LYPGRRGEESYLFWPQRRFSNQEAEVWLRDRSSLCASFGLFVQDSGALQKYSIRNWLCSLDRLRLLKQAVGRPPSFKYRSEKDFRFNINIRSGGFSFSLSANPRFTMFILRPIPNAYRKRTFSTAFCLVGLSEPKTRSQHQHCF